MSFNLTCDQIDLRQTPTNITWMCLSYNPKTKKPDGGNEGVRRRYLHWLAFIFQEQFNEACKDPEEQRFLTEEYNERVTAMKAIKRPRFSYI